MFAIYFLPDSFQARYNSTQVGEIIIGEYKEFFQSSLSYWNANKYLNQWKKAIDEICLCDRDSSFITDMYDPNLSNIAQRWVLRCDRDSGLAFVRNELLFFGNSRQSVLEENIHSYIEDRPTVNKKGQKISEWKVSLSDLHDFHSIFSAS